MPKGDVNRRCQSKMDEDIPKDVSVYGDEGTVVNKRRQYLYSYYCRHRGININSTNVNLGVASGESGVSYEGSTSGRVYLRDTSDCIHSKTIGQLSV